MDFTDPSMPPLMSPESQSPSLFNVARANFGQSMKDPKKAAILQAMLTQSLSKIGQGLGGGGAMTNRGSQAPQFDLYGNMVR